MNSHCVWHVSGDATLAKEEDKVRERERGSGDKDSIHMTGENEPLDFQ